MMGFTASRFSLNVTVPVTPGEIPPEACAGRVLNWDVVANSHFFYSVNRVGRDFKASAVRRSADVFVEISSGF